MARMSRKTEDYIDSLDREQMAAMMDRIMRAIADNLTGIFDDRTTVGEIRRIITGDNDRRAIEAGRRLFP